MKKTNFIVFTILISLGFSSLVFALPNTRSEQNIFPFVDNTYDLCSTSPKLTWKNLFVQTASTTNLTVSGLNAANCDVKSSTAGVFSCGTDSEGSSTWAFTPTTHFGTSTQATSTPLFLRG